MTWNERDTEHFLKPLSRVSLSVRERNELRSQLKARVAHTTPPALPIRSPFTSLFHPFIHPMPALALLLVVAVTTSTAAAAEGALPGDVLYPIKVHVNEEVRAALATTPEEKASWELTRAERRIDEATVLETENRLNSDVRNELDQEIEKRVASALALAPIESESPTTISALPAETSPDTSHIESTPKPEDSAIAAYTEIRVKEDTEDSTHSKEKAKNSKDIEKRVAIQARAEATRIARDRLLRRPTLAQAEKKNGSMDSNTIERNSRSEIRTESREHTLAVTTEYEAIAAPKAITVSSDIPEEHEGNELKPSETSLFLNTSEQDTSSLKAARLLGEIDALKKRLESAEKTLSYTELTFPQDESVVQLRNDLSTAYELEDKVEKLMQQEAYKDAENALKEATELAFKVIEDAQDILQKSDDDTRDDSHGSSKEEDEHSSTSNLEDMTAAIGVTQIRGERE